MLTRTYLYPGATFATLHFGDEHYEVVDGLVDLPVSIGDPTGWPVVHHAAGHADDALADEKTRDAVMARPPRLDEEPIHGFVDPKEQRIRADAEISARREARRSSDATESALHAKHQALRTDGPTLEEFEAVGHAPEHYPPFGYAEKPTERLAEYRRQQRAENPDTVLTVDDVRARESASLVDAEADPADVVVTGTVATVSAIVARTTDLARLEALLAAERAGRNRQSLVDVIETQIANVRS